MLAARPFRTLLMFDDDGLDSTSTCAECGCVRCRGEIESEPVAGDRAQCAQNTGLPAQRRTRYPFPTS